MFKKYHIPMIITPESFEYDYRRYAFLQIQIIFDMYDKKIKKIFGKENDSYYKIFMGDDDDEEAKQFADDIENEHDMNEDIEKVEELIFIRLSNLIGKELGLRFYNFTEIVEDGFIPKLVMYFNHIDSIN